MKGRAGAWVRRRPALRYGRDRTASAKMRLLWEAPRELMFSAEKIPSA